MNDNLLSVFGLTEEQTRLLYAVQSAIIENDINNDASQERGTKRQWWFSWKKSIQKFMEESHFSNTSLDIGYNYSALSAEVHKHENRTWFYLLILECIAFTPYFPLSEDKDENKKYSKCKFNSNAGYAYLKNMLTNTGCVSDDMVERLRKAYQQNMDRISNKRLIALIRVISIIAVAGIAAAITAGAAGPIAVALVGGQFAGLHGAALVSACLALLGGGAIAAGGAGMAGGVAVIAGGGALLGLAGGGAVNAAIALSAKSPDFTLTQAAKLETILKEIILNAQKDVVSAQAIIARYKDQIAEMQKEIAEKELENEKNKKDIQNLKKSLEYMKRSFEEMKKFTSSFEIGLSAQN